MTSEAVLPPIEPTDAGAPQLTADSNDRRTIVSIQIMRFLAAFAVVLYHAHLHLANLQAGHREDLIDRVFQVGASGVHVFFVISGFVMVITSFKGDRTLTPTQFFKRRLLRIYPIYWVLALTYLVVHQLLGSAYPLSLPQRVGALLLLPSYAALIIGPGWTLAYEVYFYLMFGIALAFGRRLGMILLTIFFTASVCVGVLFGLRGPISSILTNILLFEFLAGCLLGMLYRRQLAAPGWIGILAIVGGIGGLALSVALGGPNVPLTPLLGPSSVLLVGGALIIEPLLKGSVAKSLARLGDSSYFLYLVHILAIDLLLAISPIAALNRTPANAIALSVPVTIACAMLAAFGHRAIERPLLALLGRCVVSRPQG